MSATTHPFPPEEIMAHLDGELSPAQSQSVSAHIESCAACQELATSLRGTSSSLSSWTVSSASTASKTSQVSAARDADSARSYSSDRIVHLHPRRHWKLLTVSALLAVLLIMASTFRMSRLAPAAPPLAREREVMQQAMVAREQQEQMARTYLSAPVATPPDGKAMVTAGDKLKRAEDSRTLSEKKLGEFSKLQLYAKLQGKTDPQQAGPMIARTVSLSIIAKDFDSARASLDAVLVRHNGYAANLSVSTPEDAARSLQASLRIPAPQLAAALAELKSLGRVELENQNGEEVTQQHADLVARLKNSRETEQRLQAILTQRTGKISDVLEVEQEIARVRGEIEEMEAEQKNLEHRVDFATIDLKLSEEYKAKLDSATPSISTQIHNAAVNGYRNVSDTLLSIVLFFSEYGPVLAFWLLLFSIPALLVWRRWRHATAAI
jgi:hypothetical protein